MKRNENLKQQLHNNNYQRQWPQTFSGTFAAGVARGSTRRLLRRRLSVHLSQFLLYVNNQSSPRHFFHSLIHLSIYCRYPHSVLKILIIQLSQLYHHRFSLILLRLIFDNMRWLDHIYICSLYHAPPMDRSHFETRWPINWNYRRKERRVRQQEEEKDCRCYMIWQKMKASSSR